MDKYIHYIYIVILTAFLVALISFQCAIYSNRMKQQEILREHRAKMRKTIEMMAAYKRKRSQKTMFEEFEELQRENCNH